MATPLWLRSVPRNFGNASAGTLKADKWRTMFTVYLPLALVSLWGDGMSHESPDDASRLCLVLDHTLPNYSDVKIDRGGLQALKVY